MKYRNIFFFSLIVLLFASCEILFDVPLSWNKVVKNELMGMWIKNGSNNDTLIIRKNGRKYEITEHYEKSDGERGVRKCNGYLTILNNVWFINLYHHERGPYQIEKIEVKDDSLFMEDIYALEYFSDYRDKENDIYRIEDAVTFRQIVKQHMHKDNFFLLEKSYRRISY